MTARPPQAALSPRAALPRLGFYTLAGAPESSRALFDEVAAAEELGLGACFISERWNIKEAAALSGAAGAASSTMRIITAATNHNVRHPIVTASFASTMHDLTDGRFTLGIGRGIPRRQRTMGIPSITTAQMEDFAGLMRRLWRGETIVDHDGPAGSFPLLQLGPDFDAPIPLALVALGPASLALGGRAFDDVILHTFFTDDTLQRCVSIVKDAAMEAGRDPASVRVWSCFATIGDHLPEDVRLKKTVGRIGNYLRAYGDVLVKANRWDPAALAAVRADPVFKQVSARGSIDQVATIEELERIAALIPPEWLAPAATGTPDRCAAAVQRQFDLGADRVILHGASPSELEPIVRACEAMSVGAESSPPTGC